MDNTQEHIIKNEMEPFWDSMFELFGTEDDRALEMAITQRDVDKVGLLLERGANPNRGFIYAAEHGCIRIVKLLLEHGAKPEGHYGTTLRTASENCHTSIVKLLLEHGAIPDEYSLSIASEKGYMNIVKLLVKHGADIHLENEKALRHAHGRGHKGIVEYLISQGSYHEELYDFVFPNFYSWILKFPIPHSFPRTTTMLNIEEKVIKHRKYAYTFSGFEDITISF